MPSSVSRGNAVMPAANFLATWSSLVIVLHDAARLFFGAEGYSVMSIMEVMKEFTGIVAVAGGAHLSRLCSGDVEGIVWEGDCDAGLLTAVEVSARAGEGMIKGLSAHALGDEDRTGEPIRNGLNNSDGELNGELAVVVVVLCFRSIE
jgi:hypothetical protein